MGPYYNIPEAIFYLLKGDYRLQGSKVLLYKETLEHSSWQANPNQKEVTVCGKTSRNPPRGLCQRYGFMLCILHVRLNQAVIKTW